MSAIPAVSRTIKTMADGTLRLTIDIEPAHAQDAFALFGAGNVSMALAALNVGVAIPEPEPEPLKGSTLAKLAGQLVRNPDFWSWAASCDATVQDMLSADAWLKRRCGIASKKELDHDPKAAERFHWNIRLKFVAWQQRQEGDA